MKRRRDSLYPSAPLKKVDSERRIEKRLSDVNSFKNSIKNLEEMITYFKDKNIKSKKNLKKNKTITTIPKSFDTIVIFATTSSSVTLSLTGIGLRALPISSIIACGITISKKVLYEIKM